MNRGEETRKGLWGCLVEGVGRCTCDVKVGREQWEVESTFGMREWEARSWGVEGRGATKHERTCQKYTCHFVH